MIKAVIDTNVLLVANRQHAEVSEECVMECVERLISIQKSGITVIDDCYHVLGEYTNKTQVSPPKGVGDVFLKFLLRSAGNPAHVEQVTITEIAEYEFYEFPDAELQLEFDPTDRKFAALANAHPDKPPIWQAADCKWLDWWQALKSKHIEVLFLCPENVCQFYIKKFPGKEVPHLPKN